MNLTPPPRPPSRRSASSFIPGLVSNLIPAALALSLAVQVGCLSVQPSAELREMPVAAAGLTASWTHDAPPDSVTPPSTTEPTPPQAVPPLQPTDAQKRPIDWPARWGDRATGTKGVILELPGPAEAWSLRRYGEHHRGVPTDEEVEQVRRLAIGRVGPRGYDFRMEEGGGYVARRVAPRDRPPASPTPSAPIAPSAPSAPADAHDPFLVFISGRVAGERSGSPHIEIERTWMELTRPEGEPRGLVVISPGLFGSPASLYRSTARAFTDRGWAVLRLLAPPSRFIQTHTLRLDPADPAASALAAADWFDERFAEVAYAVEAGVRHAESLMPALSSAPRLFFGASGGAISGPAVVARLTLSDRALSDRALSDRALSDRALSDRALSDPDSNAPTPRATPRVDPGFRDVVLFAGGAYAPLIAATSSYTGYVDAVRFDWPGKRPGQTLPPQDILDAVAWPAVHAGMEGDLDPAAIAKTGLLDRSRVLIVQGNADSAVPAEFGEALWKLLGKPERWSAPVGHLTLFANLWLSMDRLIDWAHAADGPDNSVNPGDRR